MSRVEDSKEESSNRSPLHQHGHLRQRTNLKVCLPVPISSPLSQTFSHMHYQAFYIIIKVYRVVFLRDLFQSVCEAIKLIVGPIFKKHNLILQKFVSLVV